MQITRNQAVALFIGLNFRTAAGWDLKKLTGKANMLPDVVDEDTALEGEAQELLTQCLAAIEGGGEIEVVEGGAGAAAGAPAATAPPTTTAPAPAAAPAYADMTAADLKTACKDRGLKTGGKKEELVTRLEEADKEAAKAKAKADKAAAKEAAKEAAKAAKGTDTGTKPGGAGKTVKPAAKPSNKTGVPGVRQTASRPHIAGKIIAKHGLAAGVTPAMVAELNATYGKENDTESWFTLRNAWAAIRGYTHGDTLVDPAAK